MYYDNLQDEQYISLTTFRKNGKPVPTPVWFAQDGDTLYVLTAANSGKHKRLKNNPTVEIMASDARGNTHGTSYDGQSIIHTADSVGGKTANQHLKQKYGLFKRFFDLFQALSRTERIYLEITP